MIDIDEGQREAKHALLIANLRRQNRKLRERVKELEAKVLELTPCSVCGEQFDIEGDEGMCMDCTYVDPRARAARRRDGGI